MSSNICPNCSSDKSSEIFLVPNRGAGPKKNFSIVQCDLCKITYTNPRLSASEVEPYYGDDYYAYTTQGRKKIHWKEVLFHYFFLNYKHLKIDPKKIFLKPFFYLLWLRKKIQGKHIYYLPYIPNGQVLEIGCGTGTRLVRLEQLGWDAFGLDFSKKAIEIAQQQLPVHKVKCATLDTALFEKNTFDIILLYHSLEHFEDPQKALQQIYSLLKPGGKIMGAVPVCDGMEVKWFKTYWHGWEAPRHTVHFTKKTLKNFLEKASFKISTIKCDQSNHACMQESLKNVSSETTKKIPAFVFKWANFVSFWLSIMGSGSVAFFEAEKKVD